MQGMVGHFCWNENWENGSRQSVLIEQCFSVHGVNQTFDTARAGGRETPGGTHRNARAVEITPLSPA
jgi:hypothetical protein